MTIRDGFFLCCGVPKSGTTFLQRMLGMHPAVSCPSEQNFESIVDNLETFVPYYNKILGIFDRRTGGQGASAIDKQTMRAIFRDTILNLSRGFAGAKPVHGLNDNSIFYKLKFYDEVFASPPIICIFRNPVDRALSTWRHNHRAAEEEKDGTVDHLKSLENPEGTVEGYVKKIAAGFNALAGQYCDYAERRANFLTIRYEALVADKANELRRVFSFLKVDTAPAVIDAVVAQSSPQDMASRSSHPAFFGVDDEAKNRVTVSAAIRAQALQSSAQGMNRLGYGATLSF